MSFVAIYINFLWSSFIIISFTCIGTYSDMGKMSSSQNIFTIPPEYKFVTKNNTKIFSQKGGLAVLPCVVKVNSPATVSWIRRKDFQLLTVGLSTHSSDKRFLVEHTRHMGHWSLRIKSVRMDDRGLYECQLSIYPTQSIIIELKVLEAVAEITSSPDLHIDEGSTLQLKCKLKRATENPAFVFWYHNNKMVNYDTQNGFSVTSTIGETARFFNRPLLNKSRERDVNYSLSRYSNLTNTMNISQALFSVSPSQQTSVLLTPSISILIINEVTFYHAGNYTCAPSNARSASITVHVLRGEKPAAMQHANRSLLDGENDNSSVYSNDANENLTISKPILILIILLVLQLLYRQFFQMNQFSTTFNQYFYITKFRFITVFNKRSKCSKR